MASKKEKVVYTFVCSLCGHEMLSVHPVYRSPCPVCGKGGMLPTKQYEMPLYIKSKVWQNWYNRKTGQRKCGFSLFFFLLGEKFPKSGRKIKEDFWI